MQGIRGHRFTNWSNTFSCSPELYFEPNTDEDVRQILKQAQSQTKHVKVVGCGHSPSDIPCTSDYLLSLRKMNKVLSIEQAPDGGYSARVQCGITLNSLNDYLHNNGLFLPVQGSIGDVSIGGMLSTGTHGSATQDGNICSLVRSLRVMTVGGDILECSREEHSDLFYSATCGLGAIAILLDVTLKCVPTFNLKTRRYGAPLAEILSNIEAKQSSCEHFEFFWFPHTDYVKVVEHYRTDEAPTKSFSWFWDLLIGFYLLEFVFWLSTFCSALVPLINSICFRLLFSQERSSVGRADQELHFDCLFSQYVSEWSIPKHHVGQVLQDLKDWLASSGYKAHFPVEVRFVKGDDIWLSPAYDGDRCYINIICYRPYGKNVPFEEYFDVYQDIMFRLEGRPHWAKKHKLHASHLRSVYPRWDDFQAVRKTYDPMGLLMNSCLEQVFN